MKNKLVFFSTVLLILNLCVFSIVVYFDLGDVKRILLLFNGGYLGGLAIGIIHDIIDDGINWD